MRSGADKYTAAPLSCQTRKQVDPLSESWIKLASTVGFPIWVAMYLLVRVDNTLKEMTKAMLSLQKTIEERAQRRD